MEGSSKIEDAQMIMSRLFMALWHHPLLNVAFHPSVIFLWLACIGLVLSLWHALRQKRATRVFHQRPGKFPEKNDSPLFFG